MKPLALDARTLKLPIDNFLLIVVENVFRRGRHCYVVVYEPKKRRAHWAHPYIKINVNGRAFIAAKELSQDDRKFKLFYRISKESFAEVVRVFGPA
jgi:hypothetical protein